MPALKMTEGDKSPTACLACALYGSNPGCESVRRVTLGVGSSRQKLSRLLPDTFYPEVSFIRRGGASHHETLKWMPPLGLNVQEAAGQRRATQGCGQEPWVAASLSARLAYDFFRFLRRPPHMQNPSAICDALVQAGDRGVRADSPACSQSLVVRQEFLEVI